MKTSQIEENVLTNFEKFDNTKNVKNKIFISRSGNCMLYFSKAAQKLYELNVHKYCYLFYSKEKKKIAIHLFKNFKEGSFKIMSNNRGTICYINSGKFFRYYKIKKDVKKYFIEEKEHCGDKILLLIESEKGER